MARKGMVLAAFWLLILGAFAELPLAGATAQPVFESVSRGYMADEDNAELPKKVVLWQVVSSPMFAGLDSLIIAVECELADDEGDGPVAAGPARNRLGLMVSTLYRVREDGSRVKLTKVRSRREGDGALVGFKLIGLPGGLQEGDLLEWRIRLKRFSGFSDGRQVELLVGVGHPSLMN